jgi:V/A-type H+-transporting ATPase subunit A
VLQQDAFDEIDAVTPLERQQEILSIVTNICRAEYDFDEFQQVTDFFKKVINICKQMNYSEFKGEKYSSYYAELMEFLATRQAV